MKSRIAVIGGGHWGKNLIRNFAQLGHLEIIGDTNPQILNKHSKEYPNVKYTSDINSILLHKSIDGVIIATPAETHGDLAKRALTEGKDVFVEKPLCLDIEQGEEIVEIANKNKKILMVGHLLWYHPAILKLKELAQDGTFGRLQYIYSNRLNFGKFRRQENVLWSFAPHDISVILGLAGEFPQKIQTSGGNYLQSEIADITMTNLEFSNGIKAHIFVSWLNAFKEQKFVVVGSKMMAVFDDLNPWDQKLTLYPHKVDWNDQIPIANKAEGKGVLLEEKEPLKMECQHFLDCIKTRSTPRTSGEEGIRVLKVLKGSQSSLILGTGKINGGKMTKPSQTTQNKDFFAHETTVIDANCVIGEGTKIWCFTHILENSQIGKNCTIGQNVVIGPSVTIGNHCKIQNNVSIYNGVTLENEVFCGPSIVFTNVNNPRSEINRQGEFEKTLIKKGATLGANATIICGHTIGSYAFIGAGAVVTHNVPDYALMIGNPARQQGWACSCGHRLNNDLMCATCHRKYQETSQGLVSLP